MRLFKKKLEAKGECSIRTLPEVVKCDDNLHYYLPVAKPCKTALII